LTNADYLVTQYSARRYIQEMIRAQNIIGIIGAAGIGMLSLLLLLEGGLKLPGLVMP
jgi:hypothetical protein